VKPKKKAAKKVAKKKVAKKAAVRSRLAVPPPPTRLRVALLPEEYLELLRARGLVLTFHDPATCVTVKFHDKGGLNHPRASRSAGHHVCFQNLGKVERTLTLSHWPFQGDAREIVVPAGTTVGQFKLDPDDDYVGPITVSAVPKFDSSTGGPGDPAFDAGD
jgi:hypothetical protein